MREIKFRAWNITKKVMWNNFEVGITNNELHIIEMNECILLQFTGLLDKNGKEIYEGDIIKRFSEAYGITDDIALVEWKDYTASFIFKCVNGNEEYINTKSTIDTDIEVIGDKFRNPELMDK